MSFNLALNDSKLNYWDLLKAFAKLEVKSEDLKFAQSPGNNNIAVCNNYKVAEGGQISRPGNILTPTGKHTNLFTYSSNIKC